MDHMGLDKLMKNYVQTYIGLVRCENPSQSN
jgi:hypothetical protein